MKTLKTLLFIFLTVTLVGCNNTTRDGRNDTLNKDRNTSPYGNTTDANTDTYNSSRDVNNTGTSMYTELNMTQEQIDRFENENTAFGDSVNNPRWNRNSNMDNSLRNILDADQYRRYESLRDTRIKNNSNANNNSNQNTNQNNTNDRNNTNQNNRQ